MKFRIMNEYIQAQAQTVEGELWINIAKAIDLPRCRELAQAGNSMEEIWSVADRYFAELAAIEQKFKPHK